MQKIVVNHCPFGCQPASVDSPGDLDELGYCRHLIGFTSNGKVYEPIAPIMGVVRDEDNKIVLGMDGKPKLAPTGRVRVLGGKARKPLPAGYVLINPVRVQKGQNGTMETTNEWVSGRVYLNGPAQQIERSESLEQTVERERREQRMSQLEEELEELKQKARENDFKANNLDPSTNYEAALATSEE